MAKRNNKKRKLTPLQTDFVSEYLIDFNGTQAVIRAGYKIANESNAAKLASQLLNTPNVQEAVKAARADKIKRNLVTADYVLQKLTTICENTERENPQAALRALELLGKHLGLYTDKQEITGKMEQTIEHKQKLEQDAAAFTRAISGLVNRGGTGTVVDFPNKRAEGQS